MRGALTARPVVGTPDYERLLRLEELNARKNTGASQRQIDRLPIVPVRCRFSISLPSNSLSLSHR